MSVGGIVRRGNVRGVLYRREVSYTPYSSGDFYTKLPTVSGSLSVADPENCFGSGTEAPKFLNKLLNNLEAPKVPPKPIRVWGAL